MATKIEQMLIEYGKNAANRKLQTYYSRKSYMEKLGIARAEEPHSAYWANLLKGDDVNCDKKKITANVVLASSCQQRNNCNGIRNDLSYTSRYEDINYIAYIGLSNRGN